MADAMFGALTHGADTRSDSHCREERAPSAELREPSRAGGEAPAARLHRGLIHLSSLLESPCSRDQVGQGILQILQLFYPARQSALFVLDAQADERETQAKIRAQRGDLVVAAARGAAISLEEAAGVQRTARECLEHCQPRFRESSGEPIASFLWLPVLCEGQRVGVLEFGDGEGRWFGDGCTRELSLLADDVGRLLGRAAQISQREVLVESLERQLAAQGRECREQRRQLDAHSATEAVSRLALDIAERASDPLGHALVNLARARDEVETMQSVVSRLLDTAQALVDDAPKSEERREFEPLREALAAVETSGLRSWSRDLGPLVEDVEADASRLRSIGEDYRELALGDAAPMVWVDFAELIEASLAAISHREGNPLDCEVRVRELPPVRCQRMRVEGLLVAMLERATRVATPDSSLGLAAERRGAQLIVEISVDAVAAAQAPPHVSLESLFGEQLQLNLEIAEDHAGQLSLDRLDDLLQIRLSLALGRD